MNGLSKAQEDTLKAVVDALLPPLTAPSSHSDHRMFWEHRLSTDVHYMECLQDAIAKMRNEDRQKLKIVLSTLSTALGTTFVFGVLTRSGFCEWNVQERTKRLSQLEASFLETRRAIFQGLKQLVCGTAFTYTDPIGVNRFWNGMGYPGAPQTFQPIGQDEKLVAKAMQKQQPIIQNLKETAAAMNENRKDVLECDIVIVGSGSGGSVAAHVLSKAGYRVLIVEKGTYRAPESIPLSESDAMDQQYEQHGMLQTEDGAITIMAGSAVGGGTAINWSCCLPLPETVRNEWAKEFPEVFGSNSEYEIALQYILEKMGALDKSKVTHNAMNRKFQNGCEKLNYKWEVTGQNLQDTSDVAAGYIGMGDRYGNKNGGIQAFLVEAVENGARIIDNCRVLRVLVSRKDQGTQRAIGLQCSKDNRQFEIIARKSVILAAGALQTPCILQRSNMRNKHIGRHLRLHPAVGCFGFMSPDTYIDGILGAPMTSVCNELARGPVDDGYGVKLECPVVYPGLTAAALPWNSPTTFLGRAKRYRNAVPIVVLQRDSGNGGSVCAASDDVGFHVYYTINEHDQTSLKVGLQGAARILAASGAIEISTAHVRDPGHRSDTQDPEELEKYIATIGKRNIKKHELSMFSAHQMGTCRMSNDPANGVVDSSGETWDCDDLYVMDTSLFPTASGSNPMVTAMTISYMLSTRLSLLLLLRDDVEGSSFKSPSDFTKAQEIATLRKETRSKRLHSHWMIHKLQVLLPFLVTMVSGWVLGKIHF